jgi:hypothetical protein
MASCIPLPALFLPPWVSTGEASIYSRKGDLQDHGDGEERPIGSRSHAIASMEAPKGGRRHENCHQLDSCSRGNGGGRSVAKGGSDTERVAEQYMRHRGRWQSLPKTGWPVGPVVESWRLSTLGDAEGWAKRWAFGPATRRRSHGKRRWIAALEKKRAGRAARPLFRGACRSSRPTH